MRLVLYYNNFAMCLAFLLFIVLGPLRLDISLTLFTIPRYLINSRLKELLPSSIKYSFITKS